MQHAEISNMQRDSDPYSYLKVPEASWTGGLETESVSI